MVRNLKRSSSIRKMKKEKRIKREQSLKRLQERTPFNLESSSQRKEIKKSDEEIKGRELLARKRSLNSVAVAQEDCLD